MKKNDGVKNDGWRMMPGMGGCDIPWLPCCPCCMKFTVYNEWYITLNDDRLVDRRMIEVVDDCEVQHVPKHKLTKIQKFYRFLFLGFPSLYEFMYLPHTTQNSMMRAERFIYKNVTSKRHDSYSWNYDTSMLYFIETMIILIKNKTISLIFTFKHFSAYKYPLNDLLKISLSLL